MPGNGISVNIPPAPSGKGDQGLSTFGPGRPAGPSTGLSMTSTAGKSGGDGKAGNGLSVNLSASKGKGGGGRNSSTGAGKGVSAVSSKSNGKGK